MKVMTHTYRHDMIYSENFLALDDSKETALLSVEFGFPRVLAGMVASTKARVTGY